MQIIINGTPRQVSEHLSLAKLLQDLKLNPETTIVELNRSIIQRKDYPDTNLNEGDKLELVRVVGGG
jgi:thiamine biosynthesis protein ThiS